MVKQYFAFLFVLFILTTASAGVVTFNNMKAELMLNDRYLLDETSFVELVIWHVPKPLAGSRHQLKYRLAYIEGEVCVIRYDNEAGKGDHRHIGSREMVYQFAGTESLLVDFWSDVDAWRRQ